jgi:cell wall-associated NlpC family hydrolase
MFAFFTNALNYIKLHKIAFGVGAGVVAVGTTISLVSRKKAAAVGEKIVAKIMEHLGTPYIWGSRNPEKGLDCSGTIVFALRELGLEPKKYNATAADLWKQCSRVYIPQVGDLIFYGGGLLSGPSHVMVYMGDGKVIGSSGGGPSTTTVAKAREQGAEVKVLPMNYRNDPYGVGRLPVKEVKDESVGGLNILGSF